MNMKKHIIKFLPALFPLLLVSCLKDKAYDDGTIQSVHSTGDQKVVSIALTATSTDNHLVLALNASNTDTSIDLIPVVLGSGSGATEDVNVTLVLNPAVIGNYNGLNGTAHDVAPASLYTILNPADPAGGYIVTIPKGSNVGYLRVKIKPANFLGFDYALGVQISKVTPGYLIASNLSTGIAAIGIKNEWDGIYSYKGYSLRAGDATLTGNFTGKEVALVTSGANSVAFGSLPLWGDGNSGIAIGNPNLSISKTTTPYPVTITSPGGASNLPGYTSRYDPATKTFYIGFTWGAGPASRASTDTLTYLRPR